VIKHFGAIPYFSKRHRFQKAFGDFDGISKGQKALLWKYYETAVGKSFEPHSQPGEGDCVAHAYAAGVDILAACDIFMNSENEQWIANASVEMIYAGSRNEIGKGKLRGGGGSVGEWAAQYLQQYGVLHQLQYSNFDLTGYSVSRSTKYRDKGVPDELEPVARQHPVKTYSLITSARVAFDALYAGQLIPICSNYAFSNKRDADGFCKRDKRRKWYHCMLLAGFDDTTNRPGGLIINSWSAWNSGPTRYEQPVGSFWVDAEVIDGMLNVWQDSFAISAYEGHPKKMLHHKLY
jgi:hypothetical protein